MINNPRFALENGAQFKTSHEIRLYSFLSLVEVIFVSFYFDAFPFLQILCLNLSYSIKIKFR